jgi:hypothetical protein
MTALAPRLVGWVEPFAIPITFKDEVDGYRGVYHRAGRRPDPLAPAILRTMSPFGVCDIEVEQYSLPEGFSSERSIWYAEIFADFKTYMERAFDSDKQQ